MIILLSKIRDKRTRNDRNAYTKLFHSQFNLCINVIFVLFPLFLYLLHPYILTNLLETCRNTYFQSCNSFDECPYFIIRSAVTIFFKSKTNNICKGLWHVASKMKANITHFTLDILSYNNQMASILQYQSETKWLVFQFLRTFSNAQQRFRKRY